MSTEAPAEKPRAFENATSIAQKAVSGSVITTEDEKIVIGSDGVVVRRGKPETGAYGGLLGDQGRQVGIQPPSPLLSLDQAFDRIGTAVRANLNQLELNINKACIESSDFFKLTLIFAFMGFIIVLLGEGFFLAKLYITGMMVMINAAIAAITAAFFFQKGKEIRTLIEQYRQHILDSQRLLAIVDVAGKVEEKNARDQLKKEILRIALGMHQLN